jgi:hypothetical protein
MCDHNDIGLNAHNSPSPADIRIDDTLTEEGILDIRFVNSAEYSDLEFIRFRIIEFLQVSDRLLLLVLEICKRSGHLIKLEWPHGYRVYCLPATSLREKKKLAYLLVMESLTRNV